MTTDSPDPRTENDRRFAWWLRARDAFFKGRRAEAHAAFKRYLREPAQETGWVTTCLAIDIAIALRRYPIGEAAVEVLLANPLPDKRREILIEASRFAVRRGDLVRAETWLREALGLEVPANEPYLGATIVPIFLGNCLAMQGRLAEAEAMHRSATMLPGHPDEAWHNVGLVARAQGRLDDAVAAFDRAIAFDPDSRVYARSLHDARRAQMITASAARDPRARVHARRAYWAGDYAQALAWLEHAPRRKHGDLFRARVLASVRRFDPAHAELDLALAHATGARRGRVYALCGRVALWQRRFATAEEWYRRRMWLEPALGVAPYMVARTLTAQGRHAAATPLFEQAARDPRLWLRAMLGLLRAQRNRGNYEAALAVAARIADGTPDGHENPWLARYRADLESALAIERGGE